MPDALEIREAIINALPSETSNFGQVPDAGHLYSPPAHLRALRLESHVVIGTRGVGKSLWTAALGDESLRASLGQSIEALEKAVVNIGFSAKENIQRYPNADVFSQLLEKDIRAYDIWRSVIARWLAADLLSQSIPSETWEQTCNWITNEPEAFAHLMENANCKLEESQHIGLVVFDALDRTSQTWTIMDMIVRDLLRVILWLKSFPKLSAKAFLREDQFDRTVTDFPDASKLLATKAELTWAKHDLHGLLWQMLINATGIHGEHLRAVYQTTVGRAPLQTNAGWQLDEVVKRESQTQRALFETLAGPWMGRDRRRGVPYVWSVSHLADGRGATSPRSFLAAIRQAAEDSAERYPDHPLALHYESIKRCIQKASEIRVNEMAEDYPWVKGFLEPLRGLTVPCDFQTILSLWQEKFPQGPQTTSSAGLPPQHAERGWEGLNEDLLRLGLFERKKDGRIDMPDLYRVGFGLGRRGGVKPRA